MHSKCVSSFKREGVLQGLKNSDNNKGYDDD
jgi:hypothetical protein